MRVKNTLPYLHLFLIKTRGQLRYSRSQDLSQCDAYEQINYIPFDARRKRTEAMLRSSDGQTFLVTKVCDGLVQYLCCFAYIK